MDGSDSAGEFDLFSCQNAMQKCKRCLCVRSIVSDSVRIGRGWWKEKFGVRVGELRVRGVHKLGSSPRFGDPNLASHQSGQLTSVWSGMTGNS